MNWVVPFLLWLAIMLRLATLYFKASIVLIPAAWVWNRTVVPAVGLIPEKFRIPLAGLGTICVMIVGSFVTEEVGKNTRAHRAQSLFGLVVFIAVLYATSRDRKMVQWHTVISGMLIQFIIGLFVLRTGAGYDIFAFISSLARSLLGFAGQGTSFLTSEETATLPWFLINVLPAIIFFVALVQMVSICSKCLQFIANLANRCTIGVSFNGLSPSLRPSSFGPCASLVPKPSWPQPLPSLGRVNLPC